MGKKKNASGMGKALIRDRFRGHSGKGNTSERHTTELTDGYDWNRINLQSVTEQSNLDEFLSIAELANTDFEAERLNITVLNPQKSKFLPSVEEEKSILETQAQHQKFLQIPRRPSWDSKTTAEELDAKEKEAFLNWRRGLARLQEVEGLVVTPAERNLHFWRQLWRVIEKSDIVIQIVDARNPLLYACEDLECYVEEIAALQGVDKVNMLLINKADYLSDEQRKLWAQYFDKIGKTVAFWSATEEAKRYEMTMKQDEEESDVEDEDRDVESAGDEEELSELEEEVMDDQVDGDDDDEDWESCSSEEELETEEQSSLPAGQELQNTTDTQAEMSGAAGGEEITQCSHAGQTQHTSAQCSHAGGQADNTIGQNKTVRFNLQPAEDKKRRQPSKVDKVKNSWLLLTSEGLVGLLKSLHTGTQRGEVLTVGMTGYPNVGKSSTINTLLHAKKVAVSITPGKTKHFQTMFLDKDLLLCDCPGLVMPTFVCTKADMIVSGILPVDQMREFEAPTALVCKELNRDVLEATYGIMLPKPSEEDGEDPNRPPTPYELLTAHAHIRGFMSHKGVPDYHKSARHILKDYVKGRLLYCHPPPDTSDDLFHPVGPSVKPIKPHKEEAKKVSKQFKVDKEFFRQQLPQTHIKSAIPSHGDRSGETSRTASTQSLAEKPWKKHNNRNKKEKLRRQFRELDIHT